MKFDWFWLKFVSFSMKFDWFWLKFVSFVNEQFEKKLIFLGIPLNACFS